MGLAGGRLGAARSRCSFIGDEARRRMRPATPMRPAAAWAHLGGRRSSAMKEHRLRRAPRSGPTALATRLLLLLPRAAWLARRVFAVRGAVSWLQIIDSLPHQLVGFPGQSIFQIKRESFG